MINNDEVCIKEKEYLEMLDKINSLEKIANIRMETLLEIEHYLIDSGVDDEILKCCDIYDVNGIEIRKYIEKLKYNGGVDNEEI